MILPITPQQLILANLALAPVSTPPSDTLPECSIFSAHPCSCPSGTELVTCTTYAQMGANAKVIKEIVNDYFDLSWVGSTIKETRGCNNKLGAVRILDVPTKQGVYEWHEELVKTQSRADGSVFFEYQVKNAPMDYHGKNGTFAFDAISFKSEAVSDVQTNVSWHVRGCHTDGLQGFPEFHQIVLGLMQKNLMEAGHDKGTYVRPWCDVGENMTGWTNALDPALGGWDKVEELESEECGAYQ